jgi:hypothetical protein
MNEGRDILPDGNPKDENISSRNSVTNTKQLSTKSDMEVHAHAHSAYGKKTWKEYFWEFLMLFLAVFCGFLAEYQLEHKIEKERANEYAISLKRDLINDTTHFNESITSLALCIHKIDTLLTILSDPKEARENQQGIYRLSVYAFVFPASEANESTLQQLLNSGALRYFKNNELVDNIKKYNEFVLSLNHLYNANTGLITEFRKAQIKFIEINPILNFIDHNDFLNGAENEVKTASDFFKNEKLLSTDQTSLKEYANWCALKKFYMANSLNRIIRVKESAIILLQSLNRR